MSVSLTCFSHVSLSLSLSLSCVLTSVSLSIRIRTLEKTLVQLQSEASELRAKALEEQKKRENQDALVRRLQKRVLLLTKVCQQTGLNRF